jgi:hypothetical protein
MGADGTKILDYWTQFISHKAEFGQFKSKPIEFFLISDSACCIYWITIFQLDIDGTLFDVTIVLFGMLCDEKYITPLIICH